ncbi:MAG: nucleotidyltransferase family protein [Lachnospiraceae bacterium]|nr:nucleotidyltransferase family protein [Lachnospiraceae bacterium]
MNITGIVAEYNPFHEGHRYHIEKSREKAASDLMIAVMSGSFTQRGIPAFFDKFSRAETAVKNGIDIVCEMPFTASLASAEYFAREGVSLLNALGCDTLSFGSESGDVEALNKIAELLFDENPELSQLIKEGLSEGLSYPASVKRALDTSNPVLASLLDSPNNTLGIEYLKAIRSIGLNIKAMTIKRAGLDYHAGEENFKYYTTEVESCFPSSSLLRHRMIASGSEKYLENDDFTGILSGKIHSLSQTAGTSGNKIDFTVFADINHDLSDRINNEIHNPYTFTTIAERVKTKNLTYARICRCLWHIILDIKNEDLLAIKKSSSPEYIRILAFSEKGGKYLKEYNQRAKSDSSLPKLIIRPARDLRYLPNQSHISFFRELNAAKLYRQAYYEKYRLYLPDDYTYTIKPGTV